jgi:hypothetical protein
MKARIRSFIQQITTSSQTAARNHQKNRSDENSLVVMCQLMMGSRRCGVTVGMHSVPVVT